MTSSKIKWIAMILMTLDHIGFYFFNTTGFSTDFNLTYFILRALGRIAFPLFAFFIAEGFTHTRNKYKYLLRLLIYAVVIESILVFVYFYTGYNYMIESNPFWPLVFGLLALIVLQKKKWWIYPILAVIIVLPQILNFSYGISGVLFVLLFYYFKDIRVRTLGMIFINLLVFLIGYLQFGLDEILWFIPLKWFNLLSLVVIYFYNGKKGNTPSWIFYLYYPLHLAIIFAVWLSMLTYQ